MSFDYYSFTGRNIGFIDEHEQQLLRQARVFVCGVGGMGGAAFMALARAGVGKFVIADIDRWVIRQAFQGLRDHNTQDTPTGLSVNLSTQSLTHGDFSRYITDCLVEFNVDPRAVIFEITESGALNHVEAVHHLIQELRPFGCRFALDDFGIGFSWFAHLKHLDVDFLKIDGSFIQGLLNDPVDLAVISAITNIAHSIGKITIAQHVDRPEILRALQACGVDQVQGFYIGRPQPNLRTANGQLQIVQGSEGLRAEG